jgi:hypothetical protein
LSKKCQATWARHCPDFEVMHWSEENVNLEDPFIAHFIKKKQWAFVSDLVRLEKLCEHGGMYLDTDFEVVRPLDPLLRFSCFLGEEKAGRVNSGILGAEAGHPFLRECIALMRQRFEAGEAFWIAPEICTKVLQAHPDGVEVFPTEAFYPFNPYNGVPGNAQLMACDLTENTYAIHHWAKSWKMPLHQKIRRRLGMLLGR